MTQVTHKHPLVRPLLARRADEGHRAATPLELFFDLVFVVAIATAAADLHHGIADAHAVEALLGFALAFFAIWWAWMNFTWFASAYDNDDVPYRLLVFVQMTGALIFASGVSGLAEGNFTVPVLGYVVMRVAMVVQWLRAAAADGERRTTALRYAIGVLLVQTWWVGVLFMPEGLVWPAVIIGVVVDLAVPAWAEAAAPTTWHPHHIAERYGLLTIIVLGESVLAATASIGVAIDGGGTLEALLPTIIGGLLVLYSMWWLYFEEESHSLLGSTRAAFLWGYGHYLVFGSAAAVGAGLAVMVDAVTDHAAIGVEAAGWAVAVPVSIYVLCLWLLMDRGRGKSFARAPGPLVALALLATPFAPSSVLVTGVVLSLYVAYRLMTGRPGMPQLER